MNVLRVKPKLPNAKIGSCRSPDATGGMDNGFSSCAAPAFCCGPGISNICRCMHFPQVAGKSLSQWVQRGKFQVGHEVEKQRYKSRTVSGGRKYREVEDSSCVQMENDNNS